MKLKKKQVKKFSLAYWHIMFQALKPKSGVFCFLITEARETTALEMPDHENTFVLKVCVNNI